MKHVVIGLLASVWLAAPAMARNTAAEPHPASYYPHDNQYAPPQLQKPQASPDGVAAHILACRFALALHALGDAEEECGRAIALDGRNAQAFKLRGYAYLLEHRFERAGDDLRAGLRLAPTDPETLAGYGESLAGLGHFDQSLRWFGAAIAVAPRDARFRNARCWARAGTGKDLNLALADCNTALQLAPSMAAALDSRGLVYLRLGRLAQADADYADSLGQRTFFATAWFGRGLSRLRRGRVDPGRADILKARAIDPEIDALFVRLGVLAPSCAGGMPQKTACPEGNFPPVRSRQPLNPVAATPRDQIASLLPQSGRPPSDRLAVCTRRRDEC